MKDLEKKIEEILEDKYGHLTEDYPFQEEAIEVLTNLYTEMVEGELRKIWKMSNALYNNSIKYNDIAMRNYNALTEINKYCAKLLKRKK